MKEAAVGVVDRHSLDGGSSLATQQHIQSRQLLAAGWAFDLYIQSQHFLLSWVMARLQWRPVTCIALNCCCGTVFLCNASSQGLRGAWTPGMHSILICYYKLSLFSLKKRMTKTC